MKRLVMTLALCSFLVPLALMGSNYGKIVGRIVDSNGIVYKDNTINVHIKNWDLNKSWFQNIKTNNRGEFVLFLLEPGNSLIYIGFAGYSPARIEAEIHNDEIIEIQIDLRIMHEFDDSEHSTTTISTFNKQQFSHVYSFHDDVNSIPIGMDGRTVEGLLSLSPGVHGGAGIFGSGMDENAYLLDGLEMTDPLDGTLNSALLFDAISEVSLKGASYDAEYGGALGGVVNVITKQGTSTFKGSFDTRFRDESLIESYENPLFDPYDPDDNPFSLLTSSATLGGPLLKDKVWFFTALGNENFDYSREGNPTERNIDTWATLLKATWLMTPATTLTALTHLDRADHHNFDSAINVEPEATQILEHDHTITQLHLTSMLNEKTIVEARLALNQVDLNNLPENGDTSRAQHYNANTWTYYGGGYLAEKTNRDRLELSTDLSYHVDDLLGSHFFRSGLSYQNITYDISSRYTGSPLTRTMGGEEWTFYPFYTDSHWDDCYMEDVDGDGFEDYVCPPDYWNSNHRGYSDYWTEGEHGGLWHDADPDPWIRDLWNGTFGSFDGTHWSLYLQDEWRPASTLTIRPGIRFDRITYDDDRGKKVVEMDSFQPRLGAAWDIFNDGKTVLRGHIGRYMHPSTLNIPYYLKSAPSVWRTEYNAEKDMYAYWDTLQYIFSEPDVQAYCDYFGYQCDEDGYYMDSSWIGGTNRVADNIKTPYADVLSIGVAREFLPRTTIELSYLQKRTKNLIQDRCGGIDNEGNEIDPGDPDTWPVDPWTGESSWSLSDCPYFILDNPELDERFYYAYILDLETRYKRWFHLLFNYTYSASRGALQNTHIGAEDLDFPLHYDNAYGYLGDDRRHRIKLHGTFRLPMEHSVAFDFRWMSGLAQNLTSSSSYISELYYGTYYLERRGSRRNPSIYTLDFEVRKDLKLSDKIRGRVILTIYNLLNNQQSIDRCYSFRGDDFHEPSPEESISSSHGACGYWNMSHPASWGSDDAWMMPRRYEIGFRMTF